jgi:hypothetical protein
MYLTNKYSRWYYNIIKRAQTRTITTYTEKHHIIPQSLGGNNDSDNLVRLTAREHFICHLLLTKMTTGTNKSKMSQAAWMMASVAGKGQHRYKVNNRTYEKLRLTMSAIKKEKSTWNKGISPSDETKKRLRKASLDYLVKQGKMTQAEADYKNSLPINVKQPNIKKVKKSKKIAGRASGWKWSEEARAKLSAQRMGRTPWNKGRSLKQS